MTEVTAYGVQYDRVAEAERVQPVGQLTDGVDVGGAKPVVGGPGFRFADYSLIRTEAVIAELVGALVGAVLLGALVSMLLISIGLTGCFRMLADDRGALTYTGAVVTVPALAGGRSAA